MISTPYTARYARVGDHLMRYYEQGAGEPLLLVHGITTYSFIWRNLLDPLSENHRVIAVDLMGCGGSDKPLNIPYSLVNHSLMLAEFLDSLKIDTVHYIGHDLGAGIGQIMAVDYPARISSLTLINSVGYDFWPVQPIIAMRTPIIRQLAMACLDMGALRLLVSRGMYHQEKVTDTLIELFREPLKNSLGRKAFLHFAHSLNNEDLVNINGALHRLELPVHIIRGEGDVYLSGAIAERLHNDIAESVLTTIEKGGHFIQEDEPELLASSILSYLESVNKS